MASLKEHLGRNKNYLQLTLQELEDGIKSYIVAIHLQGITGIAPIRQKILEDLVEKGKSTAQALAAFGGKGPYDTFIQATDVTLKSAAQKLIVIPAVDPTINITLRTAAEMIALFVIDDHQFKHYSNGAGKYGLFGDLAFDDVHRLIVYGAQQLVAEQKNRGLPAVQDGYIVVTNSPIDRWHAGNGKGRTNAVKIQLGALGNSFSGHGYPVGATQYSTEVTVGQKFISINITDGAWDNTQLSAINNTIRSRVQH